ncbi:hypothetical protein [Nonomuraea sp. NPDC049141]|uniref:hypothetical protein n=1 Tax=unclassified Nonomuraea TaxID=2593643 RepID=UPI0033C547A0
MAADTLITALAACAWCLLRPVAPHRRQSAPTNPGIPPLTARYLPVDVDRRLSEALREQPVKLPAIAAHTGTSRTGHR